jgi:hypothetical protein
MGLKISPQRSSSSGDYGWDVAFDKTVKEQMSRAAYSALQDMAADIKRSGRRAIANAGLSLKWQNAWIVNVYPSTPSLRAAIEARHKIPYADLFESGGTVRGRPIMWIPTKQAPRPAGRGESRLTPARFEKAYGPLTGSRKSSGNRTPLLFGRDPISRKMVPMFFGIRLARHRSRFNLGYVVSSASLRFEGYYDKHLAAQRGT